MRMRMNSITHLKNITVQDEWVTPKPLLRSAMVNFDVLPFLDVACTEENAQFFEHITKEDDALSKEWTLDFFCNPPYSHAYDFMKKAYESHIKHNVTGLILVYAKTDTRWWHEFVENKAEVHFIKGRVKFYLDGQISKNSAPYPSCWIIYRKHE